MRVLGIDHGERRVGLALSDEDGSIAHPHATLPRRDPKALIAEIAELVREREVGLIVVGLPLSLDGREGTSARRARRFGELLAEAASVPVEMWDERLTTVAAQRALGDAGVKSAAQREMVDRVAAALLLQSYLDARRGSSDTREGDEPWGASEAADVPNVARGARRGRSRGR